LHGATDRETLQRELVALDEGDPDVLAIDVFETTSAGPTVVATTRRGSPGASSAGLNLPALASGRSQMRRLAGAGPDPVWRVDLPLRNEAALVGAVRVDFSLARLEGFERRLRLVSATIGVVAVALVSVLLALLLDRRVARPIATLVSGMRQVERGELGARVLLSGTGELAFLGRSFNRMLERLESLTAGLEAQVRRATEDLADKNEELATANEQLVQAQAEVLRSERLATLGQMAATMAHELGTPLNSILGYTQLLLLDDLAPRQIERLRIVESQVQRMIETIRSVLDRTRDRSARRAQVDVGGLVHDAVTMVDLRLARRGLRADVEVPADLPAIPGDPVGLRQALLNLLENAIDASDPAGTIVVAARLVPRDNGRAPQVELMVRDPGRGMSAEDVRLAFQPFYTTAVPERGTGLGLVIVDYIVRAHGGRIDVVSAPGEGTTVRVQLPVDA